MATDSELDTETQIVGHIRRQHSVGNKLLYEDPEFKSTDAALYKDTTTLPDYAKVEPRKSKGPHPWLYPHQFSDAPALFKGGTEASDVVQGQLGDCWLLGAMAAVANHPDGLMERLFVTPDEDILECGIVTVQLYKNGEWHTVSIDTRVPYGDPSSDLFNTPVYGRCSDPEEQWVQLLEKAYAKLHGAYEILNGGSVAEALVDFTGGTSEKIVLTEEPVKEMIASGKLWRKMNQLLGKHAMLGCSMSVRDGGFEEDAGTGILVNHAYSILHCKEAKRGLRFVKIRNPWGHGEWRGDWSDGWAGWSDHPDVEAALVDDPACNFKRGEDGVFWMVWEDFIRHFNKVYVCRLFGEEFNQYAIKGAWAGLSAAGAHKVISDIEERKEGARGPMHSTVVDGDPGWCHNPQFRVTCSEPTKMYVSLMQADRKLSGKDNNVAIRFTVTEVKRSRRERLWEEDISEIVADSARHSFSQSFPQREVSHGNIKLDPTKAYIIVPHTMQAGVETDFLLRVFSKSELSIAPLAEPFSLQVENAWTAETAGGAFRVGGRDNPQWCLNPQYWLTSPEAAELKGEVTLKVTLQRTDKGVRDDARPNNVGLTVTRVPPKKADNPRRRKLGQVRTNALGEPLPTKESTLRKSTTAAAMAASLESEASEYKMPELPPRRLEITDDQFAQSSDYSDPTVATTLLHVPTAWLATGMLVHPTLRQPGQEGTFTLSVHSNVVIDMQELTNTSFKTVTGAWAKGKTAPGCHLHGEWKRNPAFELDAPGVGTQRVRLSLSAPEELWKGTRKADPVGSMIGFYVVTCNRENDARLNDGRGGLLHETPFVPMTSVSATVELDFSVLDAGKKILILPSTFEPDKHGPFHLSVSMDAPFNIVPAA